MIPGGIFGGFGSGGVAAPSSAVTSAANRSTTGTQDFTVAGFGTPTLAIITWKISETSPFTSQTAGSRGATDGTRQWTVGFRRDQTTGGGLFDSLFSESHVGFLRTGASYTLEIAFDSFITDGVRLTVSQNGGSAVGGVLTIELFKDVDAHVGAATLPAAGNTVSPAVGFQTKALITGIALGQQDCDASFGFASYDGSTIDQCSHMFRYGDNNYTHTEMRADSIINSPFPADARYAALTSVGATNFTVTMNGDTGAGLSKMGFVAIGGVDAWAGVLDMPTTTGNEDHTDPNFEPFHAMLMPTSADTVGAGNVVDGDGAGVAFGAVHADAQEGKGWYARDGAADEGAYHKAQAVILYDHTGAVMAEATYDSWLGTGLRLNYPDVDGTARKMPALFLG